MEVRTIANVTTSAIAHSEYAMSAVMECGATNGDMCSLPFGFHHKAHQEHKDDHEVLCVPLCPWWLRYIAQLAEMIAAAMRRPVSRLERKVFRQRCASLMSSVRVCQ